MILCRYGHLAVLLLGIFIAVQGRNVVERNEAEEKNPRFKIFKSHEERSRNHGSSKLTKRSPYVDQGQAWMVILSEFPRLIKDVQENSDVRLDAERRGEYGGHHLLKRMTDQLKNLDRFELRGALDSALKDALEDVVSQDVIVDLEHGHDPRSQRLETDPTSEMHLDIKRVADAIEFAKTYDESNASPSDAIELMLEDGKLHDMFHNAIGVRHNSYEEDLSLLESRRQESKRRLRRHAFTPEMIDAMTDAEDEFEEFDNAEFLSHDHHLQHDRRKREIFDRDLISAMRRAADALYFTHKFGQLDNSPTETIKLMKNEKAVDEAFHSALGTKHSSFEEDFELLKNSTYAKHHKLKSNRKRRGIEISMDKSDLDPILDLETLEALKSAIEKTDFTNDLIRSSRTPEEALIKMSQAEKEMDEALHVILGKAHINEERDALDVNRLVIKNILKKTKRSTEKPDEMFSKSAFEHILSTAADNLRKARKSIGSGEDLRMVLANLKKNQMQLDEAIEFLSKSEAKEQKSRKRRSSDRVKMEEYGFLPRSDLDDDGFYYLPIDEATDLRNLQSYPKDDYDIVTRDLATALDDIRYALPNELEAAALGALEVGKHYGTKIQPYVSRGYEAVTREYIPKARDSVKEAIDAVPEDIKDLAWRSRNVVSTRAKKLYSEAGPRLTQLQKNLGLLGSQLSQVASEAKDYTSEEVIPNIGPALRGLIFDLQETLQLTSDVFEQDVKPLLKTINKQLTDFDVESFRNPISSTGGSALSDPSQQLEKNLQEFEESLSKYSRANIDKVELSLPKQVDAETKEKRREALENLSNQLANIGSRIQETVKNAINGIVSSVPAIVEQASSEAKDAASVFKGKYQTVLDEINQRKPVVVAEHSGSEPVETLHLVQPEGIKTDHVEESIEL